MKRSRLALQSVRIRNFKAIRDSGTIQLTPLTVFIGNNGSGKSSIIEALETLQCIVANGLDDAAAHWHGFEHIWHKGKAPVMQAGEYRPDERAHKPTLVEGRECYTDPMEFDIAGKSRRGATKAGMRVNVERTGDAVFIQQEYLHVGAMKLVRDSHGQPDPKSTEKFRPVRSERSVLDNYLGEYFRAWQFLSLNPLAMGSPVPMKRTDSPARLSHDGSNIAEYLKSMLNEDPVAFSGLVEALQFVLPYAEEMGPKMTTELERQVYLGLREDGVELPGWLLSTGTLRIVSLLALLRHPSPPPLIMIEEVENGLDPSTIHLLVRELREATQEGRTQVIITTHSPYLLDQLELSDIVVVERSNGNTLFTRPDEAELKEWASRFQPGKLYTMSRLGRRDAE